VISLVRRVDKPSCCYPRAFCEPLPRTVNTTHHPAYTTTQHHNSTSRLVRPSLPRDADGSCHHSCTTLAGTLLPPRLGSAALPSAAAESASFMLLEQQADQQQVALRPFPAPGWYWNVTGAGGMLAERRGIALPGLVVGQASRPYVGSCCGLWTK
jgi:hypothetical protein